MKAVRPQSLRTRVGSALAASALVAALLVAVHPSIGAQSGGEHWVGTWATAVVARPQTPPLPGPPGPAPFAPNECPAPAAAAAPRVTPAPGQTFGPQPYMHFTNQTLRQIVHTS